MLENILEPISNESPCGIDCKYEDAFLLIEQEIDKSNSMLDGVSTDWNFVYNESEKLLCEFTKDIKIFCWFIYASWKKESVTGLQKTLTTFAELLQTYNKALFPKSKRIKISSMLWLEELLNDELFGERGELNFSLPHEQFISVLEAINRDLSLIVEKDVEVFKKLRLALQRVQTEQKAKDVVPVQKSTQTAEASKNLGQLSEINSDEDAVKMFRLLKKNAALLQEYWINKDISDLRCIKLTRMLSWIEIDSLPADEDGITLIHAPSEMSIDEVNTFLEEENYEQAFISLEKLIALSPFWLEGHYMAADVLKKAGKEQAALEIKNALLSFVNADRKILQLKFKDSTPFASAALKKWLQDESAEQTETVVQNIVDAKEEIVSKAIALANKKQIKEAMELLHLHFASAINKEDKFYWRLAKADLAIKSGKKDIGLALLEELKKEINKYSLDEWNPELSSKVFILYLNSFNRTQIDIADINETYSRLCKTNISKALEINI